ncbi:RNA polymerase sigma-70 factor [Paenibacillus piri]|uniref:RNA polymerase sigma-70 factor n=1 Tax=Paenibacillus piri TaxID=2547395 RepID=A0A4R5KEP9_9BACL|nr:RNA polymerase sigma-70 factor [Paenibacillus piri]TDF93879.1 RNA polymerase sigma-70 factor [Paenibacillus piri]
METEQLYTEYKPLLFSLAYRMLGSVMDAEDIVQEVFLTLYKSGSDHIQNMKAYMCKIVTNRCLELLRSTSKQREVYVGTWLPEPLVTTASDETDPMQSYLQKESVSTAFLLLLQQLSYVERAVFLLREAMQYDYDEIADMVGKSSANCRQIFHRAKRSLSVKYVPDKLDHVDRGQTANLVEQFMYALTSGDAAQIMKFLSTDAVLFTDGGGKVKALAQPLHGHIRISHSVSSFLKKWPGSLTCRIAMVNGLPGIVVYMDEKTWSVISFKVLDGRIVNLYFVANPDKLTHIKTLDLSIVGYPEPHGP